MTPAPIVREAAAGSPVPPRVAKHGGTRTDPKANYDFPGMVDVTSWRRMFEVALREKDNELVTAG